MDWQNVSFDWNHARAFLAIAQEGSLSAAARALHQSQPTLGRQLSALEQELNIVLFERVGRSLVLTPAGASLVDHVSAMRDAAEQVSVTASHRSDLIEGPIAITASDVFSAYLMPSILTELRRIAPKLQIKVVAADGLQNLLRREADIAIRHVRPTEPELIARLVAQGLGHFVCSKSYLERFDRPQSLEDMNNHEFIGFGDPDQFIQHANSVGLSLTQDNFKVRSNNSVVAWEMVRSGLGLTIMDGRVIEKFPEMVPLLEDTQAFEYPIWLTTHRELHHSQKIRLVYDLLAEMIPKAMGKRSN
jgi:DNA-binding transcriptional LysR family regulator